MDQLETEKGFEEAIIEYSGLITKICYYFSDDREEFQDLRQEVLYNLWKGRENFRNESKLSTWIYRVSFNTCISFQRKEKKNKKSLPIETVLNLAAEEDPNLLEKYRMMHSLIRNLNYQDRVLILMWLEEKSYEEISELAGINRNTVAVKLKRIKEKLVKMAQKIN